MATRVYIITYDLSEPGQRWKDVDDTIKKLKTGGNRLMQSTWIITSSLDATEIRDRVWAVMDGNDKLFVSKLTTPAAWNGLPEDWTNWLKDKIVAYA